MLCWSVLGSLLTLLSGCHREPPSDDSSGVESAAPVELLGAHATGNRIAVRLDERELLYDVRSASGIGRARMRRPEDGWPPSVTFRLHLTALEGFEVRGATTFAIPATLLAEPGRPIEVSLPPDVVAAGTEALSVQWVDRYR